MIIRNINYINILAIMKKNPLKRFAVTIKIAINTACVLHTLTPQLDDVSGYSKQKFISVTRS